MSLCSGVGACKAAHVSAGLWTVDCMDGGEHAGEGLNVSGQWEHRVIAPRRVARPPPPLVFLIVNLGWTNIRS